MSSPFLSLDIVLVQGLSPFDDLLRGIMAQRSKLRGGDGACMFSHVGFMRTPEIMMETTQDLTTDSTDLWHGYRENITRVFRIPGMSKKVNRAYAAVKNQVGRQYPYARLLTYMLGGEENIKSDTYVCSELVAHALAGAGYKLPWQSPDTDQLHDFLWARCPDNPRSTVKRGDPKEVIQVFFGRLVAHWPSGWSGPFVQPGVSKTA